MAQPGFTFRPSLAGQLRSPGEERIVQIAWSPGGQSLAATAETGQILLWRREGERYVFSAQHDSMDSGEARPSCLAWSSTGTLLVSGWSDGRLRVFQHDPFKLLRESEDPAGGPILSLAVQPHSSVFVSVREGEAGLRVWNAARKTLKPIHEIPGPEEQIWGVAWHPEGEHLATCDAGEMVRIWRYDERTDRIVEIKHVSSQARQVVWSPDPDLLLARIEPGGRLKLWRTRQQGTVTLPHSGEVSSAVFSPDGSVCFSKSSDGKISMWRSPSGELLGFVEDKGTTVAAPSQPPLPIELAVRLPPPQGGWPAEERTPVPAASQFDLANVDPDDRCIRTWHLQREERAILELPPEPRTPVSKETDAPTKPKPVKILKDSIFFAGNQDQKTREDSLGFKPYVEAVADFLTDPGTKLPLTLSIEGEWGAGKSSFMEQVKTRIEDRETAHRPGRLGRLMRRWRGRERLILSFNVWRHDKEEAVWAAFTLELLRQLRAQCGLFRRFRGWLKLFARRFQWTNFFIALFRLTAWVIIVLVMAGIVSDLTPEESDPQNGEARQQVLDALKTPTAAGDSSRFQELLDSIGDSLDSPRDLAVLVLIVTLLLNAKQLFGNPLDLEIGKYLRATGWENRTTFVERFHQDFDQILRAYAGGKRVYVFVDDLDRCDVPRAADLMQAINLMISENQNLLFILGMDRMKVAAGLAVKFEKILPYLYPDAAGLSRGTDEGLVYGYEFIEKFIQIPFQLPRPSLADIKNYLRSLSPPTETEEGEELDDFVIAKPPLAKTEPLEKGSLQEVTQPVSAPPARVSSGTSAPDAPSMAPPLAKGPSRASALEIREELRLEIKGDSAIVRKTVLLVAPALDYNPRRLKQFVNSFRLRAFIAHRTGVLAGRERRSGKVTFYQLGKLVALGLRWPLLLAELRDHPSLLSKLEKAANSPTPAGQALDDEVKRWIVQPGLMSLLRAANSSPSASLADLDFNLLLQISPPAFLPAQGPPDPAAKPASAGEIHRDGRSITHSRPRIFE